MEHPAGATASRVSLDGKALYDTLYPRGRSGSVLIVIHNTPPPPPQPLLDRLRQKLQAYSGPEKCSGPFLPCPKTNNLVPPKKSRTRVPLVCPAFSSSSCIVCPSRSSHTPIHSPSALLIPTTSSPIGPMPPWWHQRRCCVVQTAITAAVVYVYRHYHKQA